MSSPVQTLPPTNAIQDPQVRAFCDALANAWNLRNGNTGSDDNDRFITKAEWNGIVNNPNIRLIAGLGDAGAAAGGGTGDGTAYNGGGPNAATQMLYQLLNEPITLLDVKDFIAKNNDLFNTINSLSAQIAANGSVVYAVKSTTDNNTAAITQINNVSSTSTSASAQTLFAVQAQSGANNAAITQINYVAADSTSAAAQTLFSVRAQSGANNASIGQINTVSATSTSANAQALYAVQVQSGNNAAGLTNEQTARLNQDTALASAINTVWGIVGNTSSLVQTGSSVTVNPNVGSANNWTQVQTAIKDDAGNVVRTAVVKQDFTTYASNTDNKLNAAWTLRINTNNNGTKTIAGLGLLVDGVSGLSSFTVEANQMYVCEPGGTLATAPFSISGGYVRMNLVSIGSFIRSDNFNGSTSSPSTIPGTAGWLITKDGTAYFHAIKIYDGVGNLVFQSGGTLDWARISGQPSGIFNSNIVINSNGTLSGAGGGQVTASGVGAVATNLSNAPSSILNSSITLQGSGGTLTLGGAGGGTISGVVYNGGTQINASNVVTYIANGAITNAQIGNYICSTNFNGSINQYGQITNVGTTGWAVDKYGVSVFSDTVVRGTVVASSVVAGSITTDGLATNAASQIYTNYYFGSGVNVSVSVTVPSGGAALGFVFQQGGTLLSTSATMTVSGGGGAVGGYGSSSAIGYASSSGSYTFTGYLDYNGGTGGYTYVVVMVFKR